MMKIKFFSTSFKKQFVFILFLITNVGFAQAPTITSFTPTSGAVGSTVTITGTGFNTTASNNVVYIGGIKASITGTPTATQLKFIVPNSAPVGLITVVNTTNKLITISAQHFRPLNNAISSFNVSSRSFANKVNVPTVSANGTWYQRGNVLSLADFNNDGKIDIAKGAANSNIGIIKNNCSTPGSIAASDFASSFNVPIGDAVYQLDAGDINGDGKIDLVAGGENGFTVVLNNSSGSTISFGASNSGANDADYYYYPTYYTARIKLADINLDGKLDIVGSSWYASEFYVYLNTSTSSTLTFSTSPTIITNGLIDGSRQMTVGDVNSDGKVDVIMGNDGTAGLLVFINTTSAGTVSFQAPISLTGNGYGQALVVDLNNDGKNDILGDGKGVFINQDTNGVYIASDFTSLNGIISNSDTFTGVSDFNGNGKLDVIGYDGYSYANIADNRSTTTTLTTANFTTVGFEVNAYADAFSTADFDGDNKQDYISSAGSNSFVNIVRNKVGEPINFYPQYSSSLEYYGRWFTDPGVWSYAGGYDQNVFTTPDYVLNFDLAGSTSYTIYSDLTISSQMKFYSAPFDIGYYNLTTSGAMTGLSSSAYIKTSGTGLHKQIVSTTPTLFGIGNTTYNPLTITNNSGSSDTFGVRVESEVRQSYVNSWDTTLGYNSLQRLWSVTKTNANGGSGVTIIFNWNASDPKNGTVTTPALFYYNNGTWTKITTGVTLSGNSLTLTGYTGTLSDTKFAIADSSYGFAPPPTITSFTPSSAVAGSTITITGTGFTGATAVTVGGTAVTSYTVVSSTSITAIVGNATNGTFQVITPGGTATSSSSFSFTPSIVKNASLTNFTTCAGTASTAQTFTVSGSNLSANISIAAVTGYEYSLNGTTYFSTLSITPTSGTVASTTVYVRLTSSSTGSPSGTISISSTNATSQTISITGTVNAITTISTQPTSVVNLCQGASYTLAGSATGSGSLAYQWYSNTTNSNTGGTSLGSTNFAQTAGLSIVTTTPGTYYYYLVVTGTCGSATSNVTTITVSPTPIAGIATPSTVTLCSGSTQTLTLSGSTGSIQWQQSSTINGTYVNVTGGTGATTASYTTPALTTTTYYKALVTSGVCTSATSNVVTVTVPSAPRPFKQALNFDGVSDKVTIPHTASLQLPNTFTLEAWVYADSSTGSSRMGVVSKNVWQSTSGSTSTNGLGYGLNIEYGKPRLAIGKNDSSWSEAVAPSNIATNTWVHLAGTYDGTTIKLYVDGALVSSVTSSNFWNNNSVPLIIGSWPNEAKFFKGNIDDVRVWNVARSASEIAQYKDVELNGSESGLVAYYDLNQGTPSGNNTTITTAIDKTSNALTGTLNTFTLTGSTSNWIAGGPLILNNPSVCLNSTFTITHTNSGGTWASSDANVISIDANTGAATANSIGTATITYSFTDNGCSYASTKLFTVNPLPAAPVATTTVDLCQGITATALTATATSGNTLQWYTVATAGSASTTAPTPVTTTVGQTIYYVSQKNNTTGCEGSRTAITVNVNAIPTISGVQNITVGGSTLQLTGSGTPHSTTPWTSSNPAAATISSSGVVTPLASGSTTITYTTVEGCSITATINVVDCNQPFGNALAFGVGTTAANADYVQINSRIFPSQSVANFTIETWIKPAASDIMTGTTGTSWLSFLGYWGTKRSPSLYITNNGVLHASWTEGSAFNGTPVSASSPTSLIADKWTHVALVKEGTTMRLYANGNQITSVTCLANLDVPDNGYWLGKNDNEFDGALDEVRFWSTARTQSQIQSTMNTELAGNETGLLAYFDFNQGVAGGTNTAITTLINKANNAINGTLTNFTKTGTASNFVGSTNSTFSISGAATMCANSTSQYTHQIPGGTWTINNGANATVSATGLVTSAANETVTLSYAYTLNGCAKTDTKTITIDTPASPAATTTINLCQGTATTALTATATTGNTLQWYTAATGGTASTTAPTPSSATVGSTIYYVSQKNTTTNCESTRTAITVNVNAIPTISGVQNMNIGGNTIQLTGSGNPSTTTPWSSSNTAVATISSTGEVTAIASGSTTITYTTAEGCSITATINVIDCNQPFGNALNFDGVDDHAILDNVGNNANFTFTGTSSFTLEVWVNRKVTGANAFIISKQGATGNYWFGLNAEGKPNFYREASPWRVTATNPIPEDEWHHIAGVYNGSQMKIYVDGTLANTVTATNTVANNVSTVNVFLGGVISNGVLSYLYKGSLDEMRVWNVARTDAQIQQSYKIALQGNETGLVAYYDFNQGVPAGDNTAITNVVNTVNSASNGVMNNFTKTGTTSNFIGSTIGAIAINGASSLCANTTSQFTHPISGGTWSVSSGAAATINASGLLTASGVENITLNYVYTLNGCSFTATKAVAVVFTSITTQPSTQAQSVCINGTTASLSVTATGVNTTYQWYKNTTASTTGGTLIAGATSSVYTPSNSVAGTTYYYCVVGGTCLPTVTSAVSGAVTITPASVSGTISGTASICSGATTTLTLTGNTGTIQWQRFDNPIWTDLTGETNATFTTPVLTQNTTYRAVITSGYCSVANTTNYNVIVNPLPVISGPISVGAGETITMTATTTAASSNPWTSSNPAVASVSNTGIVTGLTMGSTTITFTNSNGCTDTEIITVGLGTTLPPVLTSPVTNTTGATTLNFNYTLPETPLAGSVTLLFTPTGGGTPIIWTMTNATSAVFSYVVGTNPTTISNVVSGTALGFTTYDVTLAYQDAFSNPAASVTNTNVQTLAPPSISFTNTNYSGIINQSIAIQTVNIGGGMVTYSIVPTLPTGLSLNASSGLISGTPTVTLAQTLFTVTATNAAGTDTETFNLFIDADTDGDGIGNTTDPDIDGDGTLNGQDSNPTNPCIGFNPSAASSSWNSADCDNDGIPNGSDSDVDGNGTVDNGTDTDGDGINDANDPDIDGDGIPNGSDADPDGDGVVTNGPDTDGDGINDANDPDIDGDGIPNGADSDPDGNGTINNGPDTDGDGINDANDPDIDGDGIPNGADSDANGDGTIDNGAVDTDGDGIVDGADSDVNGDGVIDNGPDTDGDGVNDANDPDIDGDGIPNGADVDPDGDGTNNNGTDTDGDGINDANDPDIDGDGIPNGADADPDGDGTVNNGPDTDGDGINDANDPDIDGDGIPNGADADPDGDGTVNNVPDTDGDGINDAADADPDGNGTIDNGPDTDGDGINDANDPDIDGDGIPNEADVDPDGNGTNNNGTDMDGDGINDANDPDIDGDGIPNGIDNCPNVVNPSVTTQPNNQAVNVCPSTTPPTLTVQAVGQQLEYQWFINTVNSNVGGTAIAGATSATYTPSNTIVGPRYYYVVVYGTCGVVKSDVSGAITIQDTTSPIVSTQNISVSLNNAGTASITAAQINNGSTDNCTIASMSVAPNTFTCANVGTNTVTLTVTDMSGNTSSSTAVVTVTETILPVVQTQNISVQLNATGTASITAAQINNGSTDNCGIATMTVSSSAFTCANIGQNTVTLTVTDTNGNISTGTATVTVTDAILPTAIAQNVSVTLNAQGTAAVTATQVNNGSSDNCSIATMTVSPSTFTCANIGTNTVTLTVTDLSGNVSTASAVVTVILDNTVTGNNDLDAIPDNCDPDDDNDGILDVNDNCQFIANQNQLDTDGDGIGDICDSDDDNDGIDDAYDNCPTVYNPYQEDRDNDGQGDSCDTIDINVSDAISPNGDGVNDTWVIYNIENHPNAIVKVFNRWGKEVFKARHYQNNWGGEFGTNTETLPEGASYYYQIDLDGDGSVDNEGWLYISRK